MKPKPKPRREQANAARTAKVQPITASKELVREGLPANLVAERVVLGCVLEDGIRFGELALLKADDFSLERHRRTFRAMCDLHEAGENVDRVMVYERLRERHEGSHDDLSFLMSLSEGVPQVPHLDSWVRILRKLSALRGMILASVATMNQCLLPGVAPADVLLDHRTRTETLISNYLLDQHEIRKVEDLESIFKHRVGVEYLVKPELPAKSVVCLTGNSESGKTTLACAWARDVFHQGHAVLILDRDKNPRDRICDRLERLGIRSDSERFRVWDCEQAAEPPQPDHPLITSWIQRMVETTGKPPLVIVDSLVSFLSEDEDENSAVDMRAFFNRCRALTRLGATVIAIHHTNRNGDARGSSDLKPASDQVFLVHNRDRDGGRLLDIMTLKCEKSRYGLAGRIEYYYAGGKMVRATDLATSKTAKEQLIEILRENQGILAQDYEAQALRRGVKREQARAFVKDAAEDGRIKVESRGRKRQYFWCGGVGDGAPGHLVSSN